MEPNGTNESSKTAGKICDVLKLDRHPGIVLQLKWDLPMNSAGNPEEIYSNVIKFGREDCFRAELKREQDPYSRLKLYFVISNLNKQGIRVNRVTFYCGPRASKVNSMTLVGDSDKDHSSVFTSPSLFPKNCLKNLTFYVYIDSIVGDYHLQKVDSLLAEQLWSSAVNCEGTDLELKVQNTSFPVHKCILASRSPVFAAELNNNLSSLQIDAVDPNCMEQFLKFIYTGILEGPYSSSSSSQLLHLAKTYQVKTLESLCRTIDDWDVPETLQSKSATPDSLIMASPVIELGCTWKVNLPWNPLPPIMEGPRPIISKMTQSETSEDFEYKGRKLFRGHLRATQYETEEPHRTEDGSKFSFLRFDYSYTLNLFCYGVRHINCKIDQVAYSTRADSEPLLMSEGRATADAALLQKFISQPTTSGHNSHIHLNVKLSHTTVPAFSHKIIDSSWSKQLGDVFANQHFTDVELLVGSKSFAAHRFVLSARCPVFAAMFNSGMKESLTGSVRIEDIDPDIFCDFLRFLYTGMLEPSAINKKLFAVADRYQVEALMNLCKTVGY